MTEQEIIQNIADSITVEDVYPEIVPSYEDVESDEQLLSSDLPDDLPENIQEIAEAMDRPIDPDSYISMFSPPPGSRPRVREVPSRVSLRSLTSRPQQNKFTQISEEISVRLLSGYDRPVQVARKMAPIRPKNNTTRRTSSGSLGKRKLDI